MPPFTKDEVYELNEWIREKRGSFEEWLQYRKADREQQEETFKTAPNHDGD